jgi:ParB family chromosome partitioning protein
MPTAKEIRLDRIVADPAQPRRTFDGDRLEELADSIRIEGVLQPIVVRYDKADDTYVVVHGERRWRASQAAGLSTIPAVVRDVPEDRRLIQQLMENIVRDDLNAIDRASALRSLRSQMDDAPWEQVAEAVGIKRSRLFQLLGTEKLPESAQDDIRAGRLSEKQSRALQGLPTEHQRALHDAIVAESLPSSQAMEIARYLKTERIPDDLDAALAAIERFRASRKTTDPSETPEPDAELSALLSAVASLGTGGPAARVALTRLADWNGFAPFENERLLDEIFALAQTLARAPKSPDAETTAALAALRDALDGVLNAR